MTPKKCRQGVVDVLVCAFRKVVDLVCTLLFSAMVLGTTFTMLRDVMDVLMESTPRHINADEVSLLQDSDRIIQGATRS